MNDNYQKCQIKEGGYSLIVCDALSDALQVHPTKKSKGIFSRSVVNLTSGESKGCMIELRSGDYVGQGIVMNFCPFCGNPLRDFGEEG